MKFAVVDGKRREAQRDLSGKCPFCGDAMIPKCGQHKIPHWAHRAIRTCDPWWEETEWHLVWKNKFPGEWQEFIQRSADGEKHIADVKTDRGVVLEFQHSPLSRDERESREMFYGNMVWVVDRVKRLQGRSRFFASLTLPSIVKDKPLTFSLPLNECAILRGWLDSRKFVFFDFGDNGEPFGGLVLWLLDPHSPKGEAHLSPVLKTSFLDKYRNGRALKGIDYRQKMQKLRTVYAALLRQAPQSQPPTGFQRYLYWRERKRPRL